MFNVGDLIVVENDCPLMIIKTYSIDRYEFKEDTSNNFWEIFINETNEFTTRWGTIGTEGQTNTKKFVDEIELKKGYKKIVREKVKEGYKKINEEFFIYQLNKPSLPGTILWIPSIELETRIKNKQVLKVLRSK